VSGCHKGVMAMPHCPQKERERWQRERERERDGEEK